MPSLHPQVLDIRGTRLTDPQSVETQEDGEGNMVPAEALGGEEECTEFAPVHAPHLVGKDPRPPDVLGRIRDDTSVDVGEAVEATDSGKPPVDGARRQTALLLVALAQGVPGTPDRAKRCITALRERGWEGDDDLAALLAVALGDTPPLELRSVPVDLDELSWILEGDGSSGDGRVDLLTGEVWPEAAIDYAEETREQLPDPDDSDRWLPVSCEGSREGYRDMEYFIAGIGNSERADLLSVAIEGAGAFRRFQDVLDRWPDEKERFFAFSGERQRGRARSWLALAGVAAIPASIARSDRPCRIWEHPGILESAVSVISTSSTSLR